MDFSSSKLFLNKKQKKNMFNQKSISSIYQIPSNQFNGLIFFIDLLNNLLFFFEIHTVQFL